MATLTNQVKIKKTNDEKHLVYGEVYAPMQRDSYGDFMFPEDIELMAHRFLRLDLSKTIDTQHDNVPNGSYPVESFIARAGDPDFSEGAWVLVVKVEDEALWESVKKGEINGFSFESLVTVEEVEIEYVAYRDAFGLTEKNLDHDHAFFITRDENGKIIAGRTSVADDGHFHEIVHGSVTQIANDHAHRYFLEEFI